MRHRQSVAIFTNSMRGGGAEKVISTLLVELSAEYKFHLILLSSDIVFSVPEDVVIVKLKKHGMENDIFNLLSIPFLALKLKRYCINEGIPVCVSFLNRPNWINCCSRLIGSRHKIIISERTTSSVYYDRRKLSGKLGLWLIQHLYPLADLIVPNSKGVWKDLSLKLRVHNKYQLVYNPVSLGEMVDRTKPKSALSEFTFIFVARFQHPKDHVTIIKAVSLLARISTFKVQFVGDGELMQDARDLARDMGVNHIIEFCGFKKEPNPFLRQADCFLFSSKFEGFPNVILEALSCGLPVIATDCSSGPREILAPNSPLDRQLVDEIEITDCGILIPIENPVLMASAMRQIFEQKGMRQNMSFRAFERAKDFDAKVLAQSFDRLFNQI